MSLESEGLAWFRPCHSAVTVYIWASVSSFAKQRDWAASKVLCCSTCCSLGSINIITYQEVKLVFQLILPPKIISKTKLWRLQSNFSFIKLFNIATSWYRESKWNNSPMNTQQTWKMYEHISTESTYIFFIIKHLTVLFWHPHYWKTVCSKVE